MEEQQRLTLDGFSYVDNEHRVFKLWRDISVYDKVVDKNKDGPEFKNMDGPPFVSSENLHMGHIHVASCKSAVQNFYNMKGYNVHNKIGKDCHGLPIEMIVQKLLGLTDKHDIEKMGIDQFNQQCKDLIHKYGNAWETIYNRVARLVDFENEYKTMDTNYMETVWWVFKQLWDKGLVYRGFKIMPFSTACGTPLSNFEASGDDIYKEISDPAIYVRFQITTEGFNGEFEDCSFMVWTTTPWTLPSNLALGVNKDITYVLMVDLESKRKYIVAKDGLTNIYPVPKKKKKDIEKKYDIIKELKGDELVGLKYKPMFDYFADNKDGFKVIHGDFVTSDSGTGVVHLAPALGEDDFQVCIDNGIVTVETVGNYCPVDDGGRYTNPIEDLKGIYVRDANDGIISTLKERGDLFKKEMYTHKYPFCWRTDTPLIYRAVSSYFIRVTALRDRLVENNKKVYWVPGHIGKNRFNQWLENVRDWGVSRNRYFGTPLPIWVSDDFEEVVCVGSIDELVKLANLKERPDDIHKEFMDKIQIPSKMGKGMLKNIGLIFDCWFESGCVPYGQLHYPFENSDAFDDCEFLSDFICEGLDQTRGWFYTLMVLSVALFDKPAFKHVICTGLILGADGRKISKRLGNFIPPVEIIDRHGADAVRLYLLSSPAAKAEGLKFKETDVEVIFKKFIQLFNGYKFFLEHAIKYKKDGKTFDIDGWKDSTNITDRWILARTGSLVRNVDTLMKKLHLYKIKNELLTYIEDLTNWYIKFNRDRLRGRAINLDDDAELVANEQRCALSTLFKVLFGCVGVCAPFIPYLSETMYGGLKLVLPESEQCESVLLSEFPNGDDFPNDDAVQNKMIKLQDIANTIRSLRSKNIKSASAKIPLKHVTIFSDDDQFFKDIKELEEYLVGEINVIQIDYQHFGDKVKFNVMPDHKNIGSRFKKDSNLVKKKLMGLDQKTLQRFVSGEINVVFVEIGDDIHELDKNDFRIYIEVACKLKKTEMSGVFDGGIVIVDFEQDQKVINSYMKRLFVVNVQQMRKDTNLRPWNKIHIYYETDSDQLRKIVDKHRSEIQNTLHYEVTEGYVKKDDEEDVISRECDLVGINVKLWITRITPANEKVVE